MSSRSSRKRTPTLRSKRRGARVSATTTPRPGTVSACASGGSAISSTPRTAAIMSSRPRWGSCSRLRGRITRRSIFPSHRLRTTWSSTTRRMAWSARSRTVCNGSALMRSISSSYTTSRPIIPICTHLGRSNSRLRARAPSLLSRGCVRKGPSRAGASA
jgi:hypothetical protein